MKVPLRDPLKVPLRDPLKVPLRDPEKVPLRASGVEVRACAVGVASSTKHSNVMQLVYRIWAFSKIGDPNIGQKVVGSL